ncbi:hypothetical protein LZQ00_05845 [Sphingobacterium sp. SRCM116780]|uniref:hypothetical protein n=1 Tax=Sphingobacterium sp. SRCM116780 TaxID=2907623 RepID=UPI001F33CC54|nr:hypothetical protein [Sphingobacterium sp. SRCM116780]UIR57337.1 hypothetical protein LZQ00_05845 [Sphingobacterium sp. SRCM116780]
MIRALTTLTDAITQYSHCKQFRQDSEDCEFPILLAIDKIERKSDQLYFSHDRLEMAEQSFRTFYSKLRLLFNQLYHLKEQQADATILKIHQLFRVQEEIYRHNMDANESLTLYEYDLLKDYCANQFPSLLETLRHKQIDDDFLHEIPYAVESLLDTSTHPNIKYYQRQFILKLFSSLEKLAKDTRDKDWNQRFVELMINHNFNYMGFFNRCCEYLDKQLGEKKTTIEQEMLLHAIDFRLKQTPSDPHLAFDNTRDRLADYLLAYTAKKRIELQQEKELGSSFDLVLASIRTTCNADELKIFFHYFFRSGLFVEKTKREASENFSKHILSKTGIHIRPSQLEKFDKKGLENSAYRIRRILQMILESLNNDFKY